MADPDGNPVPGATVALRDERTNIARESVSNEQGAFRFLDLIRGRARIRACLARRSTSPSTASTTTPARSAAAAPASSRPCRRGSTRSKRSACRPAAWARTPAPKGPWPSGSSRRGTNAFHGGGFYQVVSEKLNSNNYFNNARGLAKPRSRRNEFGGSLGGPILRNKAFFFVSWEEARDELQKMIKFRATDNGLVYFAAPELIAADGRANPDFIQSPTTPGELGSYIYLHSLQTMLTDLAVHKNVPLRGTVKLSIWVEALNAFNHANFLIAPNTTPAPEININATNFGQVTVVGVPRNIQIRAKLSF